jgi:hypothetical protein
METYPLIFDAELSEYSLLGRIFVFTHNNGQRLRIVAQGRPQKIVTEGEDGRFSPESKEWKLSEFCSILKKAMTFGPFENWDPKPMSEIEKILSTSFPISQKIEKGEFFVIDNSLFHADWKHDPLYRIGQFDLFSSECAKLVSLEKRLYDLVDFRNN